MNLVPVRLAIVFLNVCLIAFLWWYGLRYFLGATGELEAEPDYPVWQLENTAGVSTGLLPYKVIWESFGHTPEVAVQPIQQPRDVDELGAVGVLAMALSYDAENEPNSGAFLALGSRPEQHTFVKVGDLFENNFEVVSIKPKNSDATIISVTLRDRRGKEIVFDFDQKDN